MCSCNGGEEKLKEFTMGHISSLLDSIHVFLLLLLLLHTLAMLMLLHQEPMDAVKAAPQLNSFFLVPTFGH